jgi:hypothetical protein
MRKSLLAISIAFGALICVSAQAAPLSSPSAIMETQIASNDAVEKVQHWRWGSGWHNRWRSHWRWGSRGNWHNRGRSHWRWGSRY